MVKGSLDKRIAERLLAKLSSSQRASEIIGDLLEQGSSPAAFYSAVLRIIVAMTWLRALGFAAALASILILLKAFIAITIPQLLALAKLHPETAGDPGVINGHSYSMPAMTAMIFLVLSIGMWIAAILILTWLPSTRHRSIVAFFLAILLTGISWSVPFPYVAAALITVLAFAILGLFFLRDVRKSLALAVSGALGCAAVLCTGVWSVASLEALYVTHLGHRSPDNLGLVGVGFFAVVFLLAPASCAALILSLHARLSPPQQTM